MNTADADQVGHVVFSEWFHIAEKWNGFADASEVSCENLATVRADTKSLTVGRVSELERFTLTSPTKMGSKRSGSAAGFIGSVTDGVDAFYRDVVQPLKPWVPSAPEAASAEAADV